MAVVIIECMTHVPCECFSTLVDIYFLLFFDEKKNKNNFVLDIFHFADNSTVLDVTFSVRNTYIHSPCQCIFCM